MALSLVLLDTLPPPADPKRLVALSGSPASATKEHLSMLYSSIPRYIHCCTQIKCCCCCYAAAVVLLCTAAAARKSVLLLQGAVAAQEEEEE